MRKPRKITCSCCGLPFGTGNSLDNHRDVDWRCLTPDEMLARGMSQNKYGLWISAKKQAIVRIR
jgi:hypothetical protein